MGIIINIDEALYQHNGYNILRLPMNKLLQDQQEAWERENPIDLLFNRTTMSTFQDTFSSTIGFNKAFKETNDYAVAPIFNTDEGFSATYRTRTFQGGFVITEQVLEDGQVGKAKDTATAFMTRWHGDIVEYAMTAVAGGFGKEVYFGDPDDGGSRIILKTADTQSGDINDPVKNPLFTNKHTIAKRRGMTEAQVQAAYQSNKFYAEVELGGNDAGQLAKLGDVINQVITIMENYKDDNGKRAGVLGAKTIVTGNSPWLKSALNSTLALDTFGPAYGRNEGYQRATLKTTPYLLDIAPMADGKGFFIIDKAYNDANHGLELTERIPLTMNVERTKNPYGISYDARQRFDVNVASWRGIAFVYLGTPNGAAGEWNDPSTFTKITPIATIAKPVTVVGEVTTKAAG